MLNKNRTVSEEYELQDCNTRETVSLYAYINNEIQTLRNIT